MTLIDHYQSGAYRWAVYEDDESYWCFQYDGYEALMVRVPQVYPEDAWHTPVSKYYAKRDEATVIWSEEMRDLSAVEVWWEMVATDPEKLMAMMVLA